MKKSKKEKEKELEVEVVATEEEMDIQDGKEEKKKETIFTKRFMNVPIIHVIIFSILFIIFKPIAIIYIAIVTVIDTSREIKRNFIVAEKERKEKLRSVFQYKNPEVEDNEE